MASRNEQLALPETGRGNVILHSPVCEIFATKTSRGIAFGLKMPARRIRLVSDMEIILDKDVEDFIQAQVREGLCTDASNLVNDVLRSVRDQQRNPFPVTPELEAWLLEAAGQPATPLTAADFARIRERVRGRVPPSAK